MYKDCFLLLFICTWIVHKCLNISLSGITYVVTQELNPVNSDMSMEKRRKCQ